MPLIFSSLFVFLLVFPTQKFVEAIDCYQCSGTSNEDLFQCNEYLNDDVDIAPQSCDNLHEAKYCVKQMGRFEADALIDCYQCSSGEMLDCADGMIHMGGITPYGCDNIFEARYCIKSTGMHGGIGTKRFCSPYNLGNYCNYVRQPGDKLTYRTCIYTCSADGCNPASTPNANAIFVIAPLLFIVLFT